MDKEKEEKLKQLRNELFQAKLEEQLTKTNDMERMEAIRKQISKLLFQMSEQQQKQGGKVK